MLQEVTGLPTVGSHHAIAGSKIQGMAGYTGEQSGVAMLMVTTEMRYEPCQQGNEANQKCCQANKKQGLGKERRIM